MNKKELAKAVDDLSSPSRRKRQEAAHAIAESMLEKPQSILSFTDDIFDALERPEAQTRWELLNSLTMIVEGNTRALAPAVHFAEPSLFDEDSSTVRLASFRFITAVGAQTKALSKKVWPMLEESIQVYHGDPQYREMLMAITEFVAAPIDPDIKKAVVARIKFDAKNSTMPIIKHLANDVLKAARGQKVQQKVQQKKNASTKQSSAVEKKSATKVSAPSKKSTVTKKASASKAASGAKKASSKASQEKKVAAKKPSTKKAAVKKAATKKTDTKKAAKTAATKKPVAKKIAAKKPASKAAAPKKPASKKSVARKAVKTAAVKKSATKMASKKTATNKVVTKKATVNKKAAPVKKSSSSRTASATKQSKTSKKTSGSKAAPQTRKTIAVKKQSATKKAKTRIAGSKAAQALKKLTSKKSR